jgi:Tol biopolymer transport system component
LLGRKTFVVAILAAILVAPALARNGSPDDARITFTSGPVRETFTPTSYGGIEDAVVVSPNAADVKRLQAKTRKRAAAFARGNFVDPTNPHGDLVPGLREMRRQWNKMHVRYEDLPNGSRIQYSTNDPVMVEALHQWFVARAVNKVR